MSSEPASTLGDGIAAPTLAGEAILSEQGARDEIEIAHRECRLCETGADHIVRDSWLTPADVRPSGSRGRRRLHRIITRRGGRRP